MNSPEITYLKILKNVCSGSFSPVAIASEDLPELTSLALRHFTSPFLLPYIKNESALSTLKQQTKQLTLQYYQLEQFTHKIAQILDNAQIPYILLKGISLASTYPQAEYRKLGDVDLYISDADAFKKACETLSKNNFHQIEEFSDHHLTFSYAFPKIQKSFLLELHYRIVGMYQYEPANQLIDQIYNSTTFSPDRQQVGTYDYTVLPPTEYVFYMLHHMLKHYLYSGFGVRLLCDFVFYLRQHADEIDFLKIHDWCRQSKILHLYEIIIESCRIYLGLSDSIDPEVHYDQDSCKQFIEKILSDSDTGNETSTALVGSTSYKKVTLGTYFKEGHFQMKLQYPRLSKCVFLWPVLWGITFFRFLHNTYKIRNTTLFQTLRQFKKKNSHTQLIRIFENSDS